jgi:Zn-dependent oligopeptidase
VGEMTDEGYLQIKLREMKTEVDELRKLVDEQKKWFENATKKMNELNDEMCESFKVISEYKGVINAVRETIESDIRKNIANDLDGFLDEFRKNGYKMLAENRKSIEKSNHEILSGYNKIISDNVDDGHRHLNLRFDRLITILNGRGITNIEQIHAKSKKEIKEINELEQKSPIFYTI